MRRFLVIGGGFAAAAIAGCSLFVDLGELSSGRGEEAGIADAGDGALGCTGDACAPGSDGSPASDGSTTADAGPCPQGLAGPAMVEAAGFCIDATEVTIKQYSDFVAAGFSGTLPPTCSWKSAFAPDTTGKNDGACTPGNVDVGTHANYPISCVDWCDAWAYCNWAGKTICANVNGGSLAYSDATSSSSAWYLACATPAKNSYPTGTTYDGGCNLASGSTIVVGSDPKCVGGYPGLYDMAGNVEEWIDACNSDGTDADAGAQNDVCHESGDAFNYTNTGPARCDNSDSDRRGAAWSDVGIRCCSK